MKKKPPSHAACLIRLPKDLYNKIVKLAKKEHRTRFGQTILVVEAGLKALTEKT